MLCEVRFSTCLMGWAWIETCLARLLAIQTYEPLTQHYMLTTPN